MGKKFKLLYTLATLCFTVAVLVFGVYAATQINFTITSTISYKVKDVFVDLQTKVYSVNQMLSEEELNQTAEAMLAEGDDVFGTLDAVVEEGGIKAVAIANTDDGYTYHFEGKKPTDKPSPLDLSDLKYTTTQGSEVYVYIIATKVTNLASDTIYAYINEAEYDEPNNSHVYKTQSYVTLETKNSSDYIIFAMALDDATRSIDDTFDVPIVITKDDSGLPLAEPSFEVTT